MSAKDFYIQPNWLPGIRAAEKLTHLEELRDFWPVPEKCARNELQTTEVTRETDKRTSGEH